MKCQMLWVLLVVVTCFSCDAGPGVPESAVPADPSQADGQAARTTADASPAIDTSDALPQYVSFPAVGVKLVRPSGFEEAESFYGFQQLATQASVMALRVPFPFPEVSGGFTIDQMATRGMTLLSSKDIVVDGNPGLLLNVKQSAYGTLFKKWIVTFGVDSETVTVTATFPKSEAKSLSKPLKIAVLGTLVDDDPRPVPGVDVGFRVVPSGRMVRTRSIGKMLMYTLDGVMPTKSPADPLLVMAPSIAKAPIANNEQYALQRISQTAQTKISSIEFHNEIEIDGLQGFETLAEGKDIGSGIPILVYQVILFDEGAYILLQGLVGKEHRAEYLPVFEDMAHSLERDETWQGTAESL